MVFCTASMHGCITFVDVSMHFCVSCAGAAPAPGEQLVHQRLLGQAGAHREEPAAAHKVTGLFGSRAKAKKRKCTLSAVHVGSVVFAEARDRSRWCCAQAVMLGVWPATRQGVTVARGWTLHMYKRMP